MPRRGGAAYAESGKALHMNLRDLPLGSLIVRDGIVRAADVRDALVEAQETDRRLGEVLLERGWIRESDLARLLAEQERLDYVDLARFDLDDRAVGCVREAVARVHGVMPYAFHRGILLVAVGDPTDEAALEAVRASARRRVRFVVATPTEIAAAQLEAYGEPLSAPAA
jgi:type IV pilus assembly protein PilB